MKIKAFIFLTILCFSCQEKSQVTERVDVPGEYFDLEDDNISVFLPSYFREFSEDEYDKLIESLPNSEEKTIERKRFDYLKFSKGNIYYFKDVNSSTLITLKMGPYVPFTKEESAYLLGVLSNTCSNYANVFGMNCEKITAGYSGNKRTKVFKAAYKMSDGKDFNTFNTLYFVSSNYKSFSLNIFSNKNKNYNAFIEKIIVR